MSTSSGVDTSYRRKSVSKSLDSERESTFSSPIVCRCGIVAPMWEAWKEGILDPGRRFVGYSRYKDKNRYYGFFKWCDPPFTERSREVNKKLRDELITANEEVQRCSLIEDESELKVVKEMIMENVQSAGKLKKMWIILICSWLIFLYVLVIVV